MANINRRKNAIDSQYCVCNLCNGAVKMSRAGRKRHKSHFGNVTVFPERLVPGAPDDADNGASEDEEDARERANRVTAYFVTFARGPMTRIWTSSVRYQLPPCLSTMGMSKKRSARRVLRGGLLGRTTPRAPNLAYLRRNWNSMTYDSSLLIGFKVCLPRC